MRRRRTVILASSAALLLGVITAIAVAWSFAAFRPFPMYPRPILGSFIEWDRPWYVSENQILGITDVWWSEIDAGEEFGGPDATPEERVLAMRARQEELERDDDRTLRHRPRGWGTFTRAEPPDRNRGADMGFGWPLRCLWYQITAEVQGNMMLNDELHGGWLLRGWVSAVVRDFRALPLRPIWHGLFLNSIFFAIIWLMILLGPGMLRRAMLRRRGCCATCGYNLRGITSERCPECGADCVRASVRGSA